MELGIFKNGVHKPRKKSSTQIPSSCQDGFLVKDVISCNLLLGKEQTSMSH